MSSAGTTANKKGRPEGRLFLSSFNAVDLVVLLRECALCAIHKVQKPDIGQAAVYAEQASIQLHDIVDPFVGFAADIVKNNAHVNTSIDLQVATIQLIKDGYSKRKDAADKIEV